MTYVQGMFIPKFRLTSRLMSWVNENWYGSNRLPANIEEVFFKSKEETSTIAYNIVCYAEKLGTTLDSALEDIIKKDASAVVRYMRVIKDSGKEIGHDFVESLKGNSNCLSQAAYHVGRLPRELEKDITDPQHLVNYARALGHRIVEQEYIFFDENKDRKKVASWVAKYAAVVGPLPSEFNQILKANNESILEYATVLANNKKNLDSDLENNLAGDDDILYKYAQNHLRRRLPTHLEKTLTKPQVILLYARQIVRGRLPEELENLFVSDLSAAASYAFDVIRGYASVRLPDAVHAAMVLTPSGQNDFNVKRYIKECENDTTVPGSW